MDRLVQRTAETEGHVVDVLQDKTTEGVPPARPVAAGIHVCQGVVKTITVPIQALGVVCPRHDGIGAEPPAGERIVPPRRQGEARQVIYACQMCVLRLVALACRLCMEARSGALWTDSAIVAIRETQPNPAQSHRLL